MSDNNKKELDEDKKFYMDMVNKLVDIQGVNAGQISENNKVIQKQNLAIQELTLGINEMKISLQNKPCISEKNERKINEGWKDIVIKSYQGVIAALFALIIGILAAFGLYKP